MLNELDDEQKKKNKIFEGKNKKIKDISALRSQASVLPVCFILLFFRLVGFC